MKNNLENCEVSLYKFNFIELSLSRKSKMTKQDFLDIIESLKKKKFPISYFNNVFQIKIEKIESGYMGFCGAGEIRLSDDNDYIQHIEKTLIHEVGHAVDEFELLHKEKEIQKEFKSVEDVLPGTNDILEYVAVGFEIYYSGTKKEKDLLKNKCCKLFKLLTKIHKKYTKSNTKIITFYT